MSHVCKSPSITLHNICIHISKKNLSPLGTPACQLAVDTRFFASRLPGKKRIKHTRLGRKMEVVKKWLSRVYIHIWVYDIYIYNIYIFFANICIYIYVYIPLLYIHIVHTYEYLHMCPQVPSEVCLFQGIPQRTWWQNKIRGELHLINLLFLSSFLFASSDLGLWAEILHLWLYETWESMG